MCAITFAPDGSMTARAAGAPMVSRPGSAVVWRAPHLVLARSAPAIRTTGMNSKRGQPGY